MEVDDMAVLWMTLVLQWRSLVNLSAEIISMYRPIGSHLLLASSGSEAVYLEEMKVTMTTTVLSLLPMAAVLH